MQLIQKLIQQRNTEGLRNLIASTAMSSYPCYTHETSQNISLEDKIFLVTENFDPIFYNDIFFVERGLTVIILFDILHHKQRHCSQAFVKYMANVPLTLQEYVNYRYLFEYYASDVCKHHLQSESILTLRKSDGWVQSGLDAVWHSIVDMRSDIIDIYHAFYQHSHVKHRGLDLLCGAQPVSEWEHTFCALKNTDMKLAVHYYNTSIANPAVILNDSDLFF